MGFSIYMCLSSDLDTSLLSETHFLLKELKYDCILNSAHNVNGRQDFIVWKG